ncbi:MAG: adenylate/guanylate cyclase domain-containing protein [Spirochaetia bacterium]|nr:adenylate/guanylate cyclase domain-containing protein [Spirochaetia bacterium]
MLQLIWNRIAYSGARHVAHQFEIKHVVLLNSLTLVVIAFAALNVPISMFFGVPLGRALGPIAVCALLLFTIVLNGRGRLLLARLYFMGVSLAFIITNAFVFGKSAPGHLFLLTLVLVVYFIFPRKQKSFALWIALLGFLLFAGFEIFHESMPGLISVPVESIAMRTKGMQIGFGGLIFAFSYYIYRTFERSEKYVQAEQEKSERLLQNILPSSVIKKLRESPDTIAERFENCTVLFSDIVGFTEMSRKMPAVGVVSLLNEIFSDFDDLAEKHQLEKIKTIGDAYMIVGGLPDPGVDHAERVALFALEMLETVRHYRDKYSLPLELRIGINSGDAVAGVIGKKKFIYDLWGDSVNTASRMESHGLPGQIQVTEATYQLLQKRFTFEDRGILDIKGLGPVKGYLLMGIAA